MQLNEQSVNVELDTSRNEKAGPVDEYENREQQSFTVDNKVETLENIETTG